MTPALKDTEGYIAIFLKAKKALVCKSVFPSPPKSVYNKPVVISEVTHQTITQEII